MISVRLSMSSFYVRGNVVVSVTFVAGLTNIRLINNHSLQSRNIYIYTYKHGGNSISMHAYKLHYYLGMRTTSYHYNINITIHYTSTLKCYIYAYNKYNLQLNYSVLSRQSTVQSHWITSLSNWLICSVLDNW